MSTFTSLQVPKESKNGTKETNMGRITRVHQITEEINLGGGKILKAIRDQGQSNQMCGGEVISLITKKGEWGGMCPKKYCY